jgi:TonB family protein
MNQDVPLADFTSGPRNGGAQTSSRVIGVSLTVCLYALMALLALLLPPSLQSDVPTLETLAILLPDPPGKKADLPLPAFFAPLIKPHAESAALPDFTVASATLPSPILVTPPTIQTSLLIGGAPTGTGASGSANGTNGNGDATSGCFDAAWAQAVTDRIGQFYHPRSTHGAIGIVMMDFTVRRSGWVEDVEVGKSSGNDHLDRMAYEMVRHAAPLPRIPNRMHTDQTRVELPMNFGVEGAIFHPAPGTCG